MDQIKETMNDSPFTVAIFAILVSSKNSSKTFSL